MSIARVVPPCPPTLGVVLAFSLFACDGGSRGDSEPAGLTVRDSIGVTIVENADPGPRDVAEWRIDTLAALSIAGSDDPAYQFNRIGSIQQLPNGMILVMDGRGEAAFEFRFYDSLGKHVATHGRSGQGPGEHRWINFVGSVGGDTVVGVDFPNSRLSWVSASAGYLRSARLDESQFRKLIGDSASGIVESMVPLGDSVYALAAFRYGQQGGTSYHIVDMAKGTVHDAGLYEDPPMKEVEIAGRRTRVWPLGGGGPQRVVDRTRRRLCSATTSRTEILCVDADGRRRIIRWTTAPVPYTDDDYDAYADRFREARLARRGMSPQDVEAWLSAMGRPENHLPFSMLQLDPEGNFWLKEQTLNEARERRTRFRVLDPEGRQIAFADSFPTPPMGFGYGIHIGRSSVLRVVRDSDDVPAIAKFVIRKPD